MPLSASGEYTWMVLEHRTPYVLIELVAAINFETAISLMGAAATKKYDATGRNFFSCFRSCRRRE
jgi:hypothetical protein